MNNPISNCCGFPPLGEIEHGICRACNEHCEFTEEGGDEPQTNLSELKDLITALLTWKQEEYQAQKAFLDGMNFGDSNWSIQNYMTGYHKGQVQILNYINNKL